MNPGSPVRAGQTSLTDAAAAVQAFHAEIKQPDMGLVAFFCSRHHDLDAIAHHMASQFGDVPVVGCTTAGEIGPHGYAEHSLSGFSLSQGAFTSVIGCIDPVQTFDLADGQALIGTLQERLRAMAPEAQQSNTFALMLIDGLSMREEQVTRTLQSALGRIRLIGGSAGDGMDFERTSVYFNGFFAADRAVILMVSTCLPFQTFKIQHFAPTERRLVVTQADSEQRVVQEINGLPATQAYAELIGVPANELSSDHFAAAPLMVLIDGTPYIRSIQKANMDGSLTFFCAIEEGMVLRIAQGSDLLGNMKQSFKDIQESLGQPQLTIVFDCILRKLENIRHGCQGAVAQVFQANNAVGLNTYGEQYCGIHVTQTLTGVAIGEAHD